MASVAFQSQDRQVDEVMQSARQYSSVGADAYCVKPAGVYCPFVSVTAGEQAASSSIDHYEFSSHIL